MGLQKLVSGTRRRMIMGEYDIDLSYICSDRVIVMSYPADGVEKFYRNDYKVVSTNHLNNFSSRSKNS